MNSATMFPFTTITSSSKALIILLLIIVAFSQNANSMTTRYAYEGPNGCNSKDCYCTTETKMSSSAGTPILMKTLKCENLTGTSLLGFREKLPAMFYFMDRVKQLPADATAKVGVYYEATTTMMSNVGNYTSEYLSVVHKNINNAYQYTAHFIGQCWEKVKTVAHTYSKNLIKIVTPSDTGTYSNNKTSSPYAKHRKYKFF